jgi:hypothetical protein
LEAPWNLPGRPARVGAVLAMAPTVRPKAVKVFAFGLKLF